MDNAQIADKLLKIANELRTHPERWTRHTNARDIADQPCAIDAAYACKWCASGLFSREFHSLNCMENIGVWHALQDASFAVTHNRDLVGFNDSSRATPARIADIFARAAAAYEC